MVVSKGTMAVAVAVAVIVAVAVAVAIIMTVSRMSSHLGRRGGDEIG